jgi:serine/threonine protein kinase
MCCGMEHVAECVASARDLNTNNVLVYSLDYIRLNVKIADFGLSRELEAGVQSTMTGYVGSPAYIAPEVRVHVSVCDLTCVCGW